MIDGVPTAHRIVSELSLAHIPSCVKRETYTVIVVLPGRLRDLNFIELELVRDSHTICSQRIVGEGPLFRSSIFDDVHVGSAGAYFVYVKIAGRRVSALSVTISERRKRSLLVYA